MSTVKGDRSTESGINSGNFQEALKELVEGQKDIALGVNALVESYNAYIRAVQNIQES